MAIHIKKQTILAKELFKNFCHALTEIMKNESEMSNAIVVFNCKLKKFSNLEENTFLFGCKDPEGAGYAITRAKEISKCISETSKIRVRYKITIYGENDAIPIHEMPELKRPYDESLYKTENTMRK